NRLDASVVVNGTTVFIEMISPERADAMIDADAALGTLAERLRDDNRGKKIELLLEGDISDEVIAEVRRLVSEAPLHSGIQVVRTAAASRGVFARFLGDRTPVVVTVVSYPVRRKRSATTLNR